MDRDTADRAWLDEIQRLAALSGRDAPARSSRSIPEEDEVPVFELRLSNSSVVRKRRN